MSKFKKSAQAKETFGMVKKYYPDEFTERAGETKRIVEDWVHAHCLFSLSTDIGKALVKELVNKLNAL